MALDVFSPDLRTLSILNESESLYKESKEYEVANVHLNVTWAQPAEKKSQLPGF